jgi:hypothetical protein
MEAVYEDLPVAKKWQLCDDKLAILDANWRRWGRKNYPTKCQLKASPFAK